MSHKGALTERRRAFSDYTEESGLKHRRNTMGDIASGKSGQVETEKRVRREIANCNERRRMQSINSGFDNLRVLLPPSQDGEKLSKATILQQTAKFINSLVIKINSLERELSVYRRQPVMPGSSVLADITEEVTIGFTRKRRPDDEAKAFDPLKVMKSDVDGNLLDLDDGNTSGRSSEFYDGHFGCSPSSASRLPPVTAESPPENTPTAARLEHLVMAIEQLEGAPSSTAVSDIEKPPTLSEPFSYVSQGHSIYYKFPDTMTDLRPFAYNIPNATVSTAMKPHMNSFSEEFMMNPNPPELAPTLAPVDLCEDKKPIPMEDYHHPVAKLLNRPIPHKYLHRPQVVVNNSH